MPRISKKLERERRNNLVEVAEKLFLLRGYDNTTINHIIEKLNLAKGTFYYHFRSKEAILIAVSEKLLEDTLIELKRIHATADQDTVWRLKAMLKVIMEDFYKSEEIWKFVYQENNVTLYHQLIKISMDKFTPLFADILEEGLKKGILDLPHATETAEVIISLVDLYAKQICLEKNETRRQRVLVTMRHILDLILGSTCVPDFKLISKTTA